MGKGPDVPDSQTVKNEPWEGVQQYLKDLYAQVGGQMNTPLEFYPGQTWVPMSPLTRMGVESNIGFINNEFPNIYDAGVGGLSDLLGTMDVGNNKYVQDMNRALTDQMTYAGNQQIGRGSQALDRQRTLNDYAWQDMLGQSTDAFKNDILSSIRNEANTQGGLGGSRQALAEIGAVDKFGTDLAAMYRDRLNQSGNAYTDYGQSVSDMVNQNQINLGQAIAQQNLGAYMGGMDAVGTALGYLPQQANLGLLPGQVYQQAGNIFEGYQQKALDEEMAKWDFYQNEPWDRMAKASSLYGGAAPYASSTTTMPGQKSDPMMNVMGPLMMAMSMG